jgi:hypothetical protein
MVVFIFVSAWPRNAVFSFGGEKNAVRRADLGASSCGPVVVEAPKSPVVASLQLNHSIEKIRGILSTSFFHERFCWQPRAVWACKICRRDEAFMWMSGLVSNRLRRPHAFRQSVLTPYQIIYSYQVTRFSCRPLLWSPFSHLCYRSYLRNSPHADRGAERISTRAKRVEWLQGLSRLASSQERSSRTARYRPTCLLFLKGAMARVAEKTIVMIIEPQRIVTNPTGERCQASGLAVRWYSRDFKGIIMIMIESCDAPVESSPRSTSSDAPLHQRPGPMPRRQY